MKFAGRVRVKERKMAGVGEKRDTKAGGKVVSSGAAPLSIKLLIIIDNLGTPLRRASLNSFSCEGSVCFYLLSDLKVRAPGRRGIFVAKLAELLTSSQFSAGEVL